MIGRELSQEMSIFSAKAATGTGTVYDVSKFKDLLVAVSATANSSLTFKLKGSSRVAQPDLSSAQAVDNMWDYLSFYDMQTGSLIAGDTGVVLDNDTVANNTHIYNVNTDSIRWVTLEVTAYTDGALTAVMTGSND
jgi:hypothetical protein